ncbi:MAG: hypothetical protein A2508_09735 [Candidatus Lambdaproteobacteria bacterium RIFOXYD12_FULL_49_8]|uniref:Response regulatory domain-containing protein n=1 Tax=Candidatus Lambdaproteobacteria bacterium RIFOXYD2_FULL_50_16 TaxID=1817772 RepID=A0A1F6G623_9PROT|nr:MAG: hypothetical protein A2527_11665 [Candidatus Lambdaproteobacteria bacterium RIFOXYD2_FULL_50_16]OGG97603.1 MAG: hypothetical protein A2508_09735 [Candidatus Lambdaproteobacteria bacterium RIFOXYD12_FULL_49_8]
MAIQILVVDDEKTIRDLVAFRLEYHGHKVVTAENGKDALAKLKQTVPDLVVLDVMMPDMTGIEVCKIIKSEPKWAAIKVLLLTAKSRKQDEEVGLAAGADGFMAKPFRANLLLEKIEELVNG